MYTRIQLSTLSPRRQVAPPQEGEFKNAVKFWVSETKSIVAKVRVKVWLLRTLAVEDLVTSAAGYTQKLLYIELSGTEVLLTET